jgi:hypothetical protein
VRGGLDAIQVNDQGKFVATFKPLPNHPGGPEEFDLVINGAGLVIDVKNGSPLFNALSQKDLINFNLLGSLDIDPHTFRVNSKHTDSIYSCGPPAFGQLLIIN